MDAFRRRGRFCVLSESLSTSIMTHHGIQQDSYMGLPRRLLTILRLLHTHHGGVVSSTQATVQLP